MPILGIIASSKLTAVGDFESIATTTVGSGGASSITFSSIPSTYKHLQLRYVARSSVGTEDSVSMRFNADSTTSYAYHFLFSNGASVNGAADTSVTRIYPWAMPGGGFLANSFGVLTMDILDYANTNKYKVTRAFTGYDDNSTGGRIAFTSGQWRSTSAISSIVINADAGNIVEHSRFALYGIKGV